MHWLAATKRDVIRVEALCRIVLIVPLSQAGRLSFSECGLSMFDFLCMTAFGASGPSTDTFVNLRLPFPLASGAFPLNPYTAPSQHLLWCSIILVVVPVLSCIRCYGGKGVVQAEPPITAVWTLCALRSVLYRRCPDVWLSSWTHVALPYSLFVTLRLDLDWTQVPVRIGVPFLLQLRAQLADVW